MKRLLGIFFIPLLAVAAEAPKFSETANLKIVNAYQRAVIAQVNLQAAQKAGQDAVTAFNELCATEVKAAGLPKGTACQVDLESQKVTTVPPKAEESKK